MFKSLSRCWSTVLNSQQSSLSKEQSDYGLCAWFVIAVYISFASELCHQKPQAVWWRKSRDAQVWCIYWFHSPILQISIMFPFWCLLVIMFAHFKTNRNGSCFPLVVKKLPLCPCFWLWWQLLWRIAWHISPLAESNQRKELLQHQSERRRAVQLAVSLCCAVAIPPWQLTRMASPLKWPLWDLVPLC